jgi:bilirubin oxidase
MKINYPQKHLLLIGFLMVSSIVVAQPGFINRIPIPPLLDASIDTIRLEMRQFYNHKFNPGDPHDSIMNGTSHQQGYQTWAYNLAGDSTMSILGPTLLWHTGHPTNIQVTNLLTQPTTTHWHGAEVPAYLDGGPHQPIAPGETWNVNFTNLDSASTMWYHPHYHNNTYPQVQLGLSGMIVSAQPVDAINHSLPHTYGIDDIPVIIGDLSIKRDTIDFTTNAFIYNVDTTKSKHPYNIVNGVTNPYMEVPAHLVRLRILNGSTRKGMQFGVSASYTDTIMSHMDDFVLVATDGGYTLKPDTLKTLVTGPGARAEIILDLTDKQVGDIVYLRNLKEFMPNFIVGSPYAPPPLPGGGGGGGKDPTSGNAFLELRIVADPVGYTPVDHFTTFASPWVPSLRDTIGVTRHRTKELIKMPGAGGGFTIDGTSYDMMTINDTVCVGAKEIWTIHNISGVAHPFHIHKIFFRILDITDSIGTRLNLDSLGLNGPKDDILVHPYWKVRFMAVFDDYPSPVDYMLTYMYHCHILTHEDSEGGGMMHQFVVTDEGSCNIGIDEENESNEVVLFPNPARDELRLKGKSLNPVVVRIINLQGQMLREQTLPAFSGIVPIDIKGLSRGLFIVQWNSVEGMITKKVIIQ